jgi:pyruvate dehydrogenase E2 component (dihydrolipoamide acetyltransferase)
MSVARVDVIMPQMGESIAEGTVSKWLKKVGDAVKRDEPIFEISTDKVDAEIPSPAAGTLAEILVTEGQTVAVQTIVARLETSAGVPVGDNGGTADRGAAASPVAAARPPAPAVASATAATPSAGAGASSLGAGPARGRVPYRVATGTRSRNGFARSLRRWCARSRQSMESSLAH